MAFNQSAIVIAHGVLGSLAWVIFFPLGSILIRLLNGPASWKTHTAIQVFSMAMFTAAVGLGFQMAKRFRALDNYHVIIGLLIFALMFIQAIAGIFHHYLFKTHLRRTVVSHIHLWLGRFLITFGMINGGLGLMLRQESLKKLRREPITSGQFAAYGAVTAIVWLVWVTVSAVYEARKATEARSSSGREEKYMSARERRGLARERRVSLRREASLTRQKNMQFHSERDSHESV